MDATESELQLSEEEFGTSLGPPAKKKQKAYTADFKLEVVNYAKANSNRQAAKNYSITPSRVREWKSQETELIALR